MRLKDEQNLIKFTTVFPLQGIAICWSSREGCWQQVAPGVPALLQAARRVPYGKRSCGGSCRGLPPSRSSISSPQCSSHLAYNPGKPHSPPRAVASSAPSTASRLLPQLRRPPPAADRGWTAVGAAPRHAPHPVATPRRKKTTATSRRASRPARPAADTPLRSSAYLSAERAGAGGAAAVARFGQQEEGAL